MCCLHNNDKAVLDIIYPTDKGDSHDDITKSFQCQIPQVIKKKKKFNLFIKCN